MLCPVQGDLEGHGRLPPALGESLVPIATGDRPRDRWVEPAWGELSLKRGAQEPVELRRGAQHSLGGLGNFWKEATYIISQ